MTALLQSPAARPQLELVFECHPVAGTRLHHRRSAYPYVLTQPFRLDPALPDLLSVILQSASGALLAGDRLVQHVSVGAGASAHVTTQAAMPVHRMPPSGQASETVRLDIAQGGFLDYLPAPRLLYPDSDLRLGLDVTVHAEARAMVTDAFVFHDPFGGGGCFRRLAGETVIRRPGGEMLAVDRFCMAAKPNRFGRAAGLIAHGSLLVLAPAAVIAGTGIAERLEAAVGDICPAAATALPRSAGIALRLAATDGGRLRLALAAAWSAARLALTGVEPDRRRT